MWRCNLFAKTVVWNAMGEAHQKQLLQIYFILIRSKLKYGAEVIRSASKTQKKKLVSVQALALRICLGAPETTPNRSSSDRSRKKQKMRNADCKIHD